MEQQWANPIWHQVGLFGVVGFLTLIALVLVARSWFKSRDHRRTRIAVDLLGNIGGSRVGREAHAELSRRGL
jgi:hypothetical protein